MNPSVHFECATCKWRHDVPDDRIAIAGGVPTSTYVPLHVCPEGYDRADVTEHGCFDVELIIDRPGFNAKIVL